MSIKNVRLQYTLLLIFACCTIILGSSCNRKKQEKGITIQQMDEAGNTSDSLTKSGVKQVLTRPSTVLLTAHAEHRLVTVYKLVQDVQRGDAYLGTNLFYQNNFYEEDETEYRKNAWHGHYMPGIEAVHGVNLLNITHYDMKTKTRNNLFAHPVWVNTLYYPAFESDTLNGTPIKRDYYLVSAYDEDTNKDSLVNYRDLRRLYLFDLDGKKRTQLVPSEYSVISSEYDSANDAMFIFASLDSNKDGDRDTEEPVHVFWFSLKAPAQGERLY